MAGSGRHHSDVDNFLSSSPHDKGYEGCTHDHGLGLLLLGSVFSRYFELYTLDWLIQSFWAQIVIAIIILSSRRSEGHSPRWARRNSSGH